MRQIRFRKRPVVIEAIRVSQAIIAAGHSWNELPEWLIAAYDSGDVLFMVDTLEIMTLEGRMTANRDDWIIRGVQGELYPCKPDIFEATYEAVTE